MAGVIMNKEEDKWITYKNGNYNVYFNLNDGTKIRINDLDNLIPKFAESIDVTISTKCDGKCEFCYMCCSTDGKHGDILNHKFLDTLHEYQELAINGNDLSHPDLIPFLEKMKSKNIIVNMTVNQIHFEKHYDFLKMLKDRELFYGLGVSYRRADPSFVEMVKSFPNAVIHVINGLVTPEDFAMMQDNNLKLLILGYKKLGRGGEYYEIHKSEIEKNMKWLYDNLDWLINCFYVTSFDNLAIEQLNVRRLLSDEEWQEFYMGDDMEFTFYLDLVNKKFAGNSLAPENEKYDLLDDIDEMFERIRKNGRQNVISLENR